jgi:hypothetical protein
VELEIVGGVKVKRNTRRCGLERDGVHVMNDGSDVVGITRVFEGKAQGTQVKGHSRFWCARGELGVQHFVNLPQTRIGGVPAMLAFRERQHGENAEQREARDGSGRTF